jgi:acetolactate synthase I/II/III large subunit
VAPNSTVTGRKDTQMKSQDGISGGEHVARALEALGVRCVFAVASVHNLPIVDAIERSRGVRIVMTRHEQGAVHAADAYARVSGELGVALTSTGPGTANAMGGLFEANSHGSPVMLITAQVPIAYYGSTSGYVHEAERQVPMLESVTRATFSVRRTADIAETLLRAATSALRTPCRPTAVEIPIDLQYATATAPECRPIRLAPSCPDPTIVDEFVRMLAAAQRPLLWVGAGIYESAASGSLLRFAERLRAPVVTTHDGKGAFPESHSLSLGSNAPAPSVRKLIAEADLVIAAGNRFPMYETDYWSVRIDGQLVHVHSDPDVIGRSYQPALAVHADPGRTLEVVLGRNDWAPASAVWQERTASVRREVFAATRASLGADHAAICDSIRRHLPPDGVVVRDLTIPTYAWGDRLLAVDVPRRALRPASSAIGPGIPFGIGAALASGQTSVVIHGDGGAMLTIGELATAAQYNVPVIVCVFCDGGYGVLRIVESRTFGERRSGVNMPTPDFAAIAAGMGLRAASVQTPDEFEHEFAAAVAHKGPSLIAVDMTKLQEPIIVQHPGWHLGER